MNLDLSSISLKDLIRDETGERFKDNKCRCPFHHEKTASLSVMSNDRFYKCFGCGKSGDAISFIQDYKHLSFIDAVKYLKLDNQLTDRYKSRIINRDKVAEKVKQVYKKENLVLKDLYEYTNEFSEVLYYRAKLKDEDNKSHARCISIVNDKVEFTRGEIKEVPYRLDAVQRALMRDKKTAIFITEGEKDADTLANIFHKCSTSLKSVDLESYDFSLFKDTITYFVGDTGKAGEQYKEKVWNALKDCVAEFNVVELVGLEKLGDNKDVTDWLEYIGNVEKARELFFNCCSYSNVWDYKKSTKWRDVIYDKKEEIYKPSKVSIRNVCEYLKSKGVKVAVDEVTTKETNLGGINEFLDGDGVLCPSLIVSILEREGCKVEKPVVEDAIRYLKSSNKVNQFQEVIKKNRNKKHESIDWFVSLLNLEDDFEKLLLRKFLFNYVRQAFNSFDKDDGQYEAQGMLILEGPQRIGKSHFVRAMGLYDDSFFQASAGIDLENENSVKKHIERNLFELSERVTTSRDVAAQLKSFLIKHSDVYRPYYTNTFVEKPRFSVFVSTTNHSKYLEDPTGSRRFWVIKPRVKHGREYLEAPTREQMEEVLGAVYDILADKTKAEKDQYCVLTTEEVDIVNNRNARCYSGGDIGRVIKDIFNMNSKRRNFYTKKDLFRLLEPYGLRVKEHADKVLNYLSVHGVEVNNKDGYAPIHKIDGVAKRGYKLWDLITSEVFTDDYDEEDVILDEEEVEGKKEENKEETIKQQIIFKEEVKKPIKEESNIPYFRTPEGIEENRRKIDKILQEDIEENGVLPPIEPVQEKKQPSDTKYQTEKETPLKSHLNAKSKTTEEIKDKPKPNYPTEQEKNSFYWSEEKNRLYYIDDKGEEWFVLPNRGDDTTKVAVCQFGVPRRYISVVDGKPQGFIDGA